MAETLLLSGLLAFIITFLVTPKAISFFKKINLTAPDAHKKNKPLVARGLGVPVFIGIFSSISAIIFIQTFILKSSGVTIPLLAGLLTLTIITASGFIDDLMTIKDKADYKENENGFRLKQWLKPLLVLPAVIPLMVIAAGVSTINIPFIGVVNFGIFYPLVLVPIAIFGAANMVNLLEGLNGTATGMGIIYSGMLGLYAAVHGRYIAAVFAFSTFGALLAAWHFHKTPAKIHAGDSLTYLLGAILAIIAILGNLEKAALIASIPFFIEFALKLRGKLKKDTIGYVLPNGNIKSRYNKIYSIPHIWMIGGEFKEKTIVYLLMLLELIFCFLIWLV